MKAKYPTEMRSVVMNARIKMITKIKRKTPWLPAVCWNGDNKWDIDNFLGTDGVSEVSELDNSIIIIYYFQHIRLRLGDVAYFENGILKRVSKDLLTAKFQI